MEDLLTSLMQGQSPIAVALIVLCYLFLSDRQKRENQHYETITTLFKQSEESLNKALQQIEKSTVVVSQGSLINEQVKEALESVTEALRGLAKSSSAKIDSNDIKRALKEIEKQRGE